MKLKKIAITNYRQFQNAVINFDDELTILAGANNSGKTSIIELFKRIFKDKNFSKEDISAEYYSKLQYDFISCINKIYNITDKETEFRENVKKEFSTENNNKWTAIKIKIEVQYDKNESISLFSDYLMELSDTCTSFFFLFNYEVNITELNKLLSLNATNLLDKKHEIQKLEAGRKTNKTRIKLTELQAEYEEFLKEIFDGALENRVYFADQNYENAGQISVREFQSLFNYNYLNATRLLNDEKTDNYFSISKELLSHFKKSNDWEEFKKQIIKDIEEGIPGWQNFAGCCKSWDDITVVSVTKEDDAWMEGKTITQIAEQKGTDPYTAIFETLIHENGRVQITTNFMDDKEVEMILSQPDVMVGSDSMSLATEGLLAKTSTHPRAFGTQTKVLSEYVRDRKCFSLESAVRKLTGLPAEVLKLDRRGTLKEGNFADIVIFNPDTVKDKATYANPKQYPEGIETVLVNGVIALENGKQVNVLPGRLLKNEYARKNQ
mgnify:CR=1 FL=1